jgi:hypothetical protein
LSEIVRIPVGIVVERRKARSEWLDYVWRPTMALAGLPLAEPWTVLQQDADTVSFFAGAAEIELYPTEASYYRDNIANGEPLLWVSLRSHAGPQPFELFKVTADPREGEAMTEAGSDLVETVAMPEPVVAELARFVARYYSDRPFVKRQRTRDDPEALSRGTLPKEGKR